MTKAIGTVLLVIFTVLVMLGLIAIWYGCYSVQEGFSLFWNLLGAISILLGLWCGYLSIKPRIEFRPVNASYDSFPLELLFELRNTGQSAIRDVVCEIVNCESTADLSQSQPLLLYTHNPDGRLVGQKTQRFRRIDPNHGETLDVGKMMPLLMHRPNAAHVSFSVSCRNRVLPKTYKQGYTYRLFTAFNGKYAWSEVAEEQDGSSNKWVEPTA